MARRRISALAVTGDALQPPAELMACFVEDWAPMSGWKYPPYARVESQANRDRSVKLDAFHAHRQARREWLAEHAVPREEQARVIPLSKPRFRDYEAFWAARGGARGA